jgi:glycosyltransferase EpsE
MPVYNGGDLLSKAIDSIINQTYYNWELLICDDNSTDSSYQLALNYSHKDPRIKAFKNEENIGSLLTRNQLFKKVKGDFIALQDADDTSSPERLEKQMTLFDQQPELALCGTWAQYFLGTKLLFVKKTATESADIFNKVLTQNQFCSASILFKKELLDDIGCYREYFKDKGNYDYDFTSRVVDKYKTTNIDEFLYQVNINNHSNSKIINDAWPIKLESDKLVQKLIIERRENNVDLIEKNDVVTLERIEAELVDKYLKDPSLIHDKRINYFLSTGQRRIAIKYVLKVFFTLTFKFRSLQLFLYTLKKTITS